MNTRICSFAILFSDNHPYFQSSSLLISTRQKGNPLLSCLRNVVYSFSDELVVDYQIGPNTGCLFLSIAYHRLHPNVSLQTTNFQKSLDK